MTRYLLDTDALIDFSRGTNPTTSLLLSWIDGNDVVAVCPVTIAEFYAGLDSSQATQWGPFIQGLSYWDISQEAAIRAGQDRYRHVRSGRAVTIVDALLAAVALEHEATLVTSNARHSPMEGLTLLSPRQALA